MHLFILVLTIIILFFAYRGASSAHKVYYFHFLIIHSSFFSYLYRWSVFRARLFRESCVYHRGNYVKDLNKLGRDLQKIVIVDNSPASYIFHPDNAVSYVNFIYEFFFLNKTLNFKGAGEIVV